MITKSLFLSLPNLILALFFFQSSPVLAKKDEPKLTPPKVNIEKLTFHDCSGECTARKQVKKLKAFEAPKSGMQNPLGVNVCQEQLGGKYDSKKLPGKERGVCRFNDGSSVELFGLHGEAEKFLQAD